MPSSTPRWIRDGLVIVGLDVVAGVACAALRLHDLGEAEVEQLDRAVRPQLDVRRLQIAMDDALLVRRLESDGDLPRDRDRLVERERPGRDAVRQRRPVDQLEHERADAVRSSTPWMAAMFG